MRARRHRRGHPVLFMFALGTLAAAVAHGDVGVALLMAGVIWWSLL